MLKTEGIKAGITLDAVNNGGFAGQLPHHIAELKKLTHRRKIKRIGQQYIEIADSANSDTSISELTDGALSLTELLSENAKAKEELTGIDLVELFEKTMMRREKGEDKGLLTGFPDLDNLTGGFKGGQLIVIAGRAKMGKSILCANLALSTLKQKLAVLFFSFEMRADELADRFISMLSGVPLSKLETGYLDDATTRAKEKLNTADLLTITGKSFGIMELKARAKVIKQRFDKGDKALGLIIVDLLTHVRAPSKERRELEVAAVTRELKVLAQELDIPVVAVSQLNRALEHRPNPRPKISDLRESGAIEQDADKILLIYRPEYYLTQKPADELTKDEEALLKKLAGTCELNVAAQRQGTNGIVTLQFDGKCTRFRPLSVTKQLQQAFGAEIVEDNRR
jgi:replicative DNA helicase